MATLESFARFGRKIRQVAGSDLTLASKLGYFAELPLGFFHLPASAGYRIYKLTGHASVLVREDSQDQKVFDEVFLENAYGNCAAPPAMVPAAGGPLILIDLGARTGLSTIALARRLNPQLIVALEPDGADFAILQENLRRTGLSHRSKTIRAFAGAERGFAQLVHSSKDAGGTRMGAPARVGIPVWRIEDLAALASLLLGEATNLFTDQAGRRKEEAPRIVLKCEIADAEARLFPSLDRWEHLVERMILRTGRFSAESLHTCLDASRYGWRIEGEPAPNAAHPVMTLERGELRPAPQTQRAAVS